MGAGGQPGMDNAYGGGGGGGRISVEGYYKGWGVCQCVVCVLIIFFI